MTRLRSPDAVPDVLENCERRLLVAGKPKIAEERSDEGGESANLGAVAGES
jgi:hypothetical protein